MADKKINLDTAFERGFKRGMEDGKNPDGDLLNFGLKDQHYEVLGDLYIADDADFINGLEDEFIEGYLEGGEKYVEPDRWVNLPAGGYCFVTLWMTQKRDSLVKMFGPFATTFDAKDWIDIQPKDVARNMTIQPLSRTDLVRSSDDFWRVAFVMDEKELW